MIWGTIRVVFDRSGQHFQYADEYDWYQSTNPDANLDSIVSQENAWGFGQVIAVLLLGLPLLSFFEVVYGKTSCSLVLNNSNDCGC